MENEIKTRNYTEELIAMNAHGDILKHGYFSIRSLYEHIEPLAKRIAGKEKMAETAYVLSTILILGVLFLSFGHALQGYTVMGPAPF